MDLGTKKHSVFEKITQLICILRLRIQPAVPYATIANILEKTFPNLPAELSQHHDQLSHGSSLPYSNWLTATLQQIFEDAEKESSSSWVNGRDLCFENIAEIMRITGLAEEGYKMAERGEMEAQIKWRKEGDWKAGSEPLTWGDPTREYFAFKGGLDEIREKIFRE